MNMTGPRILLRPIQAADLSAVVALHQTDMEGSPLTVEYLDWWYCKKPVGSFTCEGVWAEGKLEGMATTNNFFFHTQHGRLQFAMPQKVITSDKIRGQGYFSKLYFQCEAQNIAQGIDGFLTFTNANSTPIFLSKFGYIRGISPAVHIIPALPYGLQAKRYAAIRVEEFAVSYPGVPMPNASEKDVDLIKWRYSYQTDAYKAIRLDAASAAIVKKFVKAKLPLLAVMDFWVLNQSHSKALLQQLCLLALRMGCVGIMVLEHEALRPVLAKLLKYTDAHRFNFLVKGGNGISTEQLAEIRFNFTFSDLDFM